MAEGPSAPPAPDVLLHLRRGVFWARTPEVQEQARRGETGNIAQQRADCPDGAEVGVFMASFVRPRQRNGWATGRANNVRPRVAG